MLCTFCLDCYMGEEAGRDNVLRVGACGHGIILFHCNDVNNDDRQEHYVTRATFKTDHLIN